MDIGTGIAVGSGCFAIVAGVLGIFKVRQNNGNGNGKKHCEDHSGVCVAIDNFTGWLNKIESKLDKAIERT